MSLLLHCCCAPCSVACVNSLRSENINFKLFWFNPNIHGLQEYKQRLDCIINFSKNENLELLKNGEYGLKEFLTQTDHGFDLPPVRCEKCYRMRLEKTASYAAKEGFDSFSTTLLISPYQDHEAIKRIGGEYAAKYNIEFLYRDFRPLFREGQSIARNKNFYMQKYCGCIFSEEERDKEKSSRQGTKNAENAKEEKRSFSSSSSSSASFAEPSAESLRLCEKYFDRINMLVGDENLKKLSKTSALVFGLGGVGSWTAEALVRSGIGKIGIIDNDVVCASNVNRQAEATSLTLGQPKASALKKRLLEINPECDITVWDELFCRENAMRFNIEKADYVIDAIDSLEHKLDLIELTLAKNVTLFSSMGMALKTDPLQIRADSIWKTDVCPLARLVRQGLRKRGFNGDFTVVYSGEKPVKSGGSRNFGSIVTVTASAGFLLASLVLRDITSK
ncbi:MAG: epoxyqueuosine reductase QueH [Treponema sp.]|nr:epoxyqueuosine reductase QueH [Treponema sp.]